MSDELDRVAMLSDVRAVRSDLAAMEKRLEKRIGEVVTRRISQSEERIRRHFDIMVEKVESAVRLVAEVNVHHSSVLDEPELRLQKIEKRRS